MSLQSRNVSGRRRSLAGVRAGEAAVDLRLYMNRGPITVTPITPICEYGVFRGMGTRHTPVVNDAMEPVGMITRKELMSDFQYLV